MESSQAVLPERLAVILKNARAVREVCDYTAGDDIGEDLTGARQALVRYLCQSLRIPEGWRRPYLEGNIWLHPERKWNVPGKDTIAIAVCLPSPADEYDQDASVNLYVPLSRKPLERFTESLRPIVPRGKDWVYIRDSEPGEVSLNFPMGKWIRYENYADSTGFNTATFFQAITDTVGEFLKLEAEIDRLIKKAKATQSGGQARRKRKSL